MTALAFKLVLILGVALGSVGGTAAVAANSLPDSAIFPVKLAIEQARLSLTQDSGRQAELHLEFAQERAQEIQALAARGRVPAQRDVTRLQQHLEAVVNLAAELPDEMMSGLLQRTRQMIRAEQQGLAQAQLRVAERARERLQQAQDVLARVDDEAELGQADPDLFRWRHTHNRPDDAPTPPEMTPGSPQSTPAGGNQHQFGPPSVPPGPGTSIATPACPNCTPVHEQNQNQEQHQEQNQIGDPQGNEQQAGGQPSGGQQSGSQQENSPSQGATGSPGQQGSPSCTDCDSAGGQNQNGQQSGGGQNGPGR